MEGTMGLFDFSYEFPNTIEEIDQFSGKDFEVFLFEFFQVLEYHPRLTDDSNDKGIDIIIKIPNENGFKNVGIQAKRWKSKVGADEIRSMLDGKDHYNFHEAWIITTSNLTSAAITTAKNNRIQILKRENVIQFLAELKKHDNVNFKKIIVEQERIVNEQETIDNPLYNMLKELRKELAKKHKITPLYYVYSNSTIISIINTVPKTKDELISVEGLGTKKIELYGEEIINTVSNYLNSSEFLKEVERFKIVRSKIMCFNKLPNENSVITDENLAELIINRPKTIEELKSLCVIEEKNIKIFGQYLVKQFIQL